jgi:hypothetical protein
LAAANVAWATVIGELPIPEAAAAIVDSTGVPVTTDTVSP